MGGIVARISVDEIDFCCFPERHRAVYRSLLERRGIASLAR